MAAGVGAFGLWMFRANRLCVCSGLDIQFPEGLGPATYFTAHTHTHRDKTLFADYQSC